ncbi:MAG: hypothetical protein D6720_03875 [Gammaproteobacteria bacterium]|nr:MAG: hypothetical protein D6720_03875 [Gammaproteobacteria bacterium]
MAAKEPPPLIHIGLPKCASTFLQRCWRADSRISLAYHELAPIIGLARQKGHEGRPPPRALTPPRLTLPPHVPGRQSLVLSHEALSNAYINERADESRIACFQQWAAALTKAAFPKARILIVTREPASWILSIYNQAVKQGGTDTFRQFLRRESTFLERSCDLRELFVIWRQHFGSDQVLMLPVEWLREDQAGFFRALHRFSGVETRPPPADQAQPVNPSLAEGHLDVMRQFNRWVELLVTHGRHRGSLPDDLAQALSTLRFATRYTLESPTPELNRRLRRIERQMRIQHPDKAMIPKELLKRIRKRNAKHFKKDDFFGYAKHYV